MRRVGDMRVGEMRVACFNNLYKVTPDSFAAWMRILAASPSALLWILNMPVPTCARTHARTLSFSLSLSLSLSRSLALALALSLSRSLFLSLLHTSFLSVSLSHSLTLSLDLCQSHSPLSPSPAASLSVSHTSLRILFLKNGGLHSNFESKCRELPRRDCLPKWKLLA